MTQGDEMSSEQRVQCEWGEAGAARFCEWADVVVVVDVLSFSTCVDIATSAGAHVFPLPWRDGNAEAFAAARDAVLAMPRGESGFTLSPGSFSTVRAGDRVVLPSPNGARVTIVAAPAPVLVGCLRNARAVAKAAVQFGPRIAVIPAGERWPDNSLRPCVADLIGVGAIVAELELELSLEAQAAKALFGHFQAQLGVALRDSVSGRELIDRGYPGDVDLAAQLNVSQTVPALQGDCLSALKA